MCLAIRVRRFRCPNAACARATFAEDFGEALPRYARRTLDAARHLLEIALVAGGEAGARVATSLGLPISPDTLLRLVRHTAPSAVMAPRVLGVDDLALRRRHRYATLLVDLETRRPVDLLAGRDADDLASWLTAHPGVDTVVRDRSDAYAEGTTKGAPNAQQVADRFHLAQNASAALEEVLRSRKRQLEVVAEAAAESAESPTPTSARPLSPSQRQTLARRQARVARWERVRGFRRDGWSISQIAREMGMNRRTVRHYLATREPPHHHVEHLRPGGVTSPTLQPYVPYLQERWAVGCQNVSQLHRELVAMGYQASRSLLAQALHPWRPPRAPKDRRGKGRPRRLSLRWLCLRPPDRLPAEEHATLEKALAEDPSLAQGHALLQRFRRMIRERVVAMLDPWLTDAQASGLEPFRALANGIVADRLAVDAALTTRWSNGPTEGHVHRVKLLKRQGYGRAKLDLLRARVLAA